MEVKMNIKEKVERAKDLEIKKFRNITIIRNKHSGRINICIKGKQPVSILDYSETMFVYDAIHRWIEDEVT